MSLDASPEIEKLASVVIGSAIEVHRALGPGYLESVYQEALAVELTARRVLFEREYRFAVLYRERKVGVGIIDFFVGSALVVELKTVEKLLPIHRAQVISYLKATRCPLGLLLNFKTARMTDGLERVILSTP